MSRGRQAEKPTDIPKRGWYDIAIRIKDRIGEDSISLTSAGVAFYGLLALFPAITAILAVGGLLMDPAGIVDQINSLRGVVPDEAMDIIENQALSVVQLDGLGWAAVLGVLGALWSASRGVSSLMEGLNIAYDEEEERGLIKRNLQVLGITILLIIGIALAIGAILILPVVMSFVDLGNVTEILISLLRWVVMGLLTIGGLSVLYRYGPSRDDPEWNWVLPGAIVGCIGWVIASSLFTFYVGNFASYNESFGTLGGVIILLMWLWVSAFIVMIGATLNAEMEAQTRKDTTVGEDRPMGMRDAEKADRLGETARQ